MTTQDPQAAARALDGQARRQAQSEFQRPLVVEAGAGTGKTATLVARVLAWTLGPGWERAARELAVGTGRPPGDAAVAQATLRGVVAITFTEAAAAEMAERVGEGMRDVARGEPPTGLAEDLLPPSVEIRGRRARALLEALDLLEVRTIHAWCARLLQEHAVAAGLHPAFQVDADGEQRTAVVREVVEAALVAGLGEPADPDLLELAVQGVGPDALVQATTAFVEAAVDASALQGDPMAEPAIRPLVQELSLAVEALHDALAPLAAAKRTTNLKRLWLALAELRPEPRPDGSLAAAGAVALALVEDHGGALTALRQGKLNKTEDEALGEAGAMALQAGARLARVAAFLAELDPDGVRRALRVVAPLVARAQARLRAMGCLGFSQLLVEAASLLARLPATCQRVRRGLRQLLVDEFQDTDPCQCRIVAHLALEGPEDERPGLFIVGDPKQSIYGWRSADLRAYEGFVDRVLQAGGHRLSLVVNFRSVPAVLDAVEGAVRPVMRQEAGRQPAFQRLVACERLAGQPGHRDEDRGPVELWSTWSWQGEGAARVRPSRQLRPAARRLESAAVAVDIAGLHARGVSWREIAVLFRSTGDLPVLVQALRDAGVPYAVERDRSYFLRREVAEAAALVSVVTAPHDHVALVSWLRSAMVGVPDAALLPLWRHGLPRAVTEARRPRAEDLAELGRIVTAAASDLRALHPPPPGLDRVAGWADSLLDALGRLLQLRAAFALDPADVFVARLRRLSMIEATEAGRYQGAWRLANLDRLFRGLLQGLAEGGEVHGVLRHLREGLAGLREGEEGRPQEAAQDAVQLMTIHKAKGLGFDHVYVVGLDKGSGGRREPSTVVHDAGAWRLFGQPSPGLLPFRAETERVAAAEQVRLLYVAMTRAKQRLVLTGQWDEQPGPVAPEDAACLVELLGAWAAVPADLGGQADQLPLGRDRLEAGPVTWVFPGRWAEVLAAPPPGSPGAPPPGDPATPERIRADGAALERARQQAAIHMQRPWTQGPSALAHDSLRATLDQQAERSVEPGPGVEETRVLRLAAAPAPSGPAPGEPPPPDPSDVATAAGSAVHLVLERLALDLRPLEPPALAPRGGDPAGALLQAAAGLEQDLALAHPPAVAAAAAVRARELLVAMAGGRLLARLWELGPAVVARELPVLLPADPSAGAVGALVGAIDLVYRDPADGALVVADYKTDDVEPDAAGARAAVYAPQLGAYARALQEALDLPDPPRAELWFLRPDRVVVL